MVISALNRCLEHDQNIQIHHVISPFVKWAGGKRQLLPILQANMPKSYGTYFEPFIGGGALFFSICPVSGVVSDTNKELINAYEVIRDDVEALIRSLMLHKNEEDYYYKVRSKNVFKLTAIQRASRFIFLNKTCFNGLYRENSQGQFNTPFGRYINPTITNKKNLRSISSYLNNSQVLIKHQSFEETAKMASKGDFIYFDPPYYPISETANFTKYVKADFTAYDQEKLAIEYQKLTDKGCYVMLSNSNSDFIKLLYKDFKIIEIEANRFINCKAEKRGKQLNEVLIKNY